jgi:CRISPR system Cascade subunit CasA
VAKMRFVAGEGLENPAGSPDPMQPFRIDKERGRLPMQFREHRGTWRDFDSLLPDQEGRSPLTMQNAVRLAGNNVNALPKAVMVLGLRYSPPNANVDFWRMERFALPEALAGNQSVRSEIKKQLVEAEDAQRQLWASCRSFARNLLSRGRREPDKKDINAFVEQMQANSMYWSTLEYRFHEILGEYTLNSDSEAIQLMWLKAVRDALKAAWQHHRASVAFGDAWAIRALVKSEGAVQTKLGELNDQIGQADRPQEVI